MLCAPGAGTPNMTTGYNRMGWTGEWSPTCNFTGDYAPCSQYPAKNAFDGVNNRTTLGTTNCCNGANDTNCNNSCTVARATEKIGDTFTFDMQGCHTITSVEMYCGNPPNNSGQDARDIPGQVEALISGDCTTSSTGAITGTFVSATPMAIGNEPQVNGKGCSLTSCTTPFVVTFPPNTAARCIKLKLTKQSAVIATQPQVWWAIDEIYVK
jgi:hypothetical protein